MKTPQLLPPCFLALFFLACGGKATHEVSQGAEGGRAATSTATEAGGAGGAPTAPLPEGDANEGVFPQDRVLQIDLTLPEGAWEKMIATATAEQYSRSAVNIDGYDLGEVGVRFKGAYSLESCISPSGELTCEKLSLKLKFHEYNPDTRFFGLKKLNLNKILDGGDVVRESLSYSLYRDMGITTPRTSYAVVRVNGKSEGLYTVVEALDGRFTADRFPDKDGNLYKEAWPDRPDAESYNGTLETNELTGNYADIAAFSAAMRAANDSNLVETLGRYMDLDQLANYMAVDYAIANWDGIQTFYCGSWGCGNHNFFVYQDVDSPRFTLIPWDLNATLFLDHWLGNIPEWDDLTVDCDVLIPTADGGLSTRPAACDPMMRALALRHDAYEASLKKLLDEHFTIAGLTKRIDAYAAQVRTATQGDPYMTSTEFEGGLDWVKAQLPDLRARAEAVLAP